MQKKTIKKIMPELNNEIMTTRFFSFFLLNPLFVVFISFHIIIIIIIVVGWCCLLYHIQKGISLRHSGSQYNSVSFFQWFLLLFILFLFVVLLLLLQAVAAATAGCRCRWCLLLVYIILIFQGYNRNLYYHHHPFLYLESFIVCIQLLLLESQSL